MAITTATVSKAAGWARTDIVLQLEEAFTWLGWHGGTLTGIVTSIGTYTGGGTVGTSNTDYFDVYTATTSGIGTGASFWVDRQGGNINAIYVNRPGYGYTHGESVTLSPADIGGAANGATGIAFTVSVAGGNNPIGYGSTNQFYDKDITAGATNPWGVLRHTIQSGKKYGDTYRLMQPYDSQSLAFYSCSGFHPWNDTNQNNRNNQFGNRFAGTYQLDMPWNINSYSFTTSSNISVTYPYAYQHRIQYASSNAYKLDLNIFRSGLDPKFAVLSFRQPTISSLKLRDNTFGTFFFHNFTTPLWDLDQVYLGGMTTIYPNTDEGNPVLIFRTFCQPFGVEGGESIAKRMAEYGYIQSTISDTADSWYKTTYYASNSYPRTPATNTYAGLYVRNNDAAAHRGRGGDNYTSVMDSSTNFNAVIKQIPINAQLIPVPYYIPDDFVLIDFDYALPLANIQQGDTITISGSEVYTVITGSYNQTTRTRGILFCARTV